MLDLDLLRCFVSVVDAGGFTRAGERIHRTQSTVSQQVRRLEESVGRTLLHRSGQRVVPTEDGERLLGYARRMLAIEAEARDVLSRREASVVRLGLPEDFAARRLAEILSEFAAARPSVRLDVRCELSVRLRELFERGDLDVALMKRDPGAEGALGRWAERLRWVAGPGCPPLRPGEPVPLVVFQQGCLYRDRAVHALEAAGRDWRIAYSSPNTVGVQAAVATGLGIGVLPEGPATEGLVPLGPESGLPPLPGTELVLMCAPAAPEPARELARRVADTCEGRTRAAA
jgi:DNA-binding transcriptional LysR family regulator